MRTWRQRGISGENDLGPGARPDEVARGPDGPRDAGPDRASPPTAGSCPDGGPGASSGAGPQVLGMVNGERPGRSPGLSARVDLINGHSTAALMAGKGRALWPGRSARRRREAMRVLEERAGMHVPDGDEP